MSWTFRDKITNFVIRLAATVKGGKADVSSVSPSARNVSFFNLYGG